MYFQGVVDGVEAPEVQQTDLLPGQKCGNIVDQLRMVGSLLAGGNWLGEAWVGSQSKVWNSRQKKTIVVQ